MNRRSFLATAASTIALPRSSYAAEASPLASHKIERVEFRNVNVPWPRLVGRNAVKGLHGTGGNPRPVCVLHTNEGAIGWGSGRGNKQRMEQLIVGKTVDQLIDPASGIRSSALRAADFALHDLAGNILSQPVWKMMGAESPKLTKIYSGMIYFDDLDPEENPAGIDKVLENCQWDYDYGYRQFKVKIGRGNKWMLPLDKGLQRDIDVVKAIHESFPDVEILVDGNNGFTLETMLRFLKGIEGIPLFWIEEPFHENVEDWKKLHGWLVANGREETYRADGEFDPDILVLEELEKTKAVNMRLQDISSHGFTNWRRLMPKLIETGIAASPHTWGSSLKTVYTAHLAAALGNTPTVEGVTTEGGNVDFGENKIVDAQFRPSSAPGFGLKLPG
ncbi:MAG: enolase C-terminal domain-like protein [Verrucomicrobiota bacterium]